MKKKTNKFTLVCILLMFLFTNLCFNVNAEVYNDETSQIQDVNENCNEGNNSEQILDNPLSTKEINEISKENFNNSNVRASAVPQIKSSNITEGKIHPVVILIKFKGQDNSIYSSNTINDLKDALVGDKNSVNGFLKSISYNKCSIDPYFAFEQNSGIYIYEAPKGREGYHSAYTNDSWENGKELLKEAFKSVKDKIPSNIDLDVNNDGEIDAIYFVVPEQTNRGEFLWPHKWEIYDETGETDVNGLVMGKYNLIPTSSIGYRTNNGSYNVMAHEFLHLLGYPDMYINGNYDKPVGEWSVMSNGKCYPTVWERIKYGGWISENQIPIISQSGEYELSDVTKNPNTNTIAYKIPIPNSNEFFMVEYRNKEANDYDSKVPNTGIIVYRVNPNITGNSSDESEIYILRNPGLSVFGAGLDGKFEHKFMDLTLKSGEYTGYTIEFISSSNGKASFKLVKNNGFSITSFEKSTQDYVSVVDNIKLKANTVGATGNVTYSFGTIVNNKKIYFNKDSSNNSFSYKFSNIFSGNDLFNEAIGNHTLFVEAKDEANHKDIKYINNLVVKPLEITKLETNVQSPEIVNTPITISADFKYAASVQGITNSGKFIITKNGQSEVIGSGKKITWTPTEPGTYEITYEVTDGLNQVAKKSITFNVENKTIIYYKGYSNPKIHYQIGNGQWTGGNGVLMTSCTDVPGYDYSISIDLGKELGITACFNNGANSWDNNNKQNYKFGSGYYTFSNGVITKINKPIKKLKIDSISSKLGSSYVSGNENVFTAQVSNASGKVQYQFEYKNKTTGVSGVLRNYSQYNKLETYLGTPGEYTLTVYVKDEAGNTDSKTLDFRIEEYKNLEIKSVASSLGDTFKKGKTTQLTINVTGGMGNNYYSIEVNGQSILDTSSSNTVSWTPTEAGKYKITVTAREAQGGTASYTKTITVEDKVSNQTTIYYRGYDNAHIHYQIGNGAWTTKPVKMNSSSDVAGYNYAMTIDLGDAEQLTACFNDGSNGWDSNNGNN